MKKFIYRVFVFFVLVFITDIIFGAIMRFSYKNTNGDEIGRDKYICDSMNAEVLVFGSSRAQHHYNTSLMTDSLRLNCYNCGEAGYGIILAYGRLLMILKRYTPKTIIYDITPAFDYLDYHDNTKHLYRLKPFYDREGVDSIFWDVDPREKYKMYCNMYRYNSLFLRNSAAFLLGLTSKSEMRGYEPLYGEMDTFKILKNYKEYDSRKGYSLDSLKIKYLKKFVDAVSENNINIVFVSSPVWYGQDSIVLNPVRNLCKDSSILILDYTNDPEYVHEDRYFKDGKHLNSRGADNFTQEIIQLLKNKSIVPLESSNN